jgi:hypothetical protein
MAKPKSSKPPARPETVVPQELAVFPTEVREYLEERAAGKTMDTSLDAILVGTQWDGVRRDLTQTGVAMYRNDKGEEAFLVADFDTGGKVMNIAAAIPRTPGSAYDFMSQVQDFQTLQTATQQGRWDACDLFHKIYRNDGTSNNAINKLAALISPEGAFKVRSVKGQRGKSGDKAAEELESALNWWKDNVNVRGDFSVITGDRGLASFILRGARLALIEGDHISRHVWAKKAVLIPNLKPFTLPMNLQTFSVRNIYVPTGLEGTNFELMYWYPPKRLISELTSPSDPNMKPYFDAMIPADVRSALIADGRYFLDPALMIHIKHRGTGVETFGESILEPTLADIRYKRALDALEITTITNLINRLVIVKVGSDNPDSVYHKQEVSSARLGLLQRLFKNVGPSSTILWGGPDIEVVEIGAHNAILALDDRWKVAERRQLMSLGLPAVLMVGEGSDGKATGFAAALGVAAQLKEMQYQYVQALKTLAEAIALENGYEQVDVVWEFADNVLEDKQAAADMILKMFDRGLASTQTAIEELGFDYGAEQGRQEQDVALGYKPEAFGPPLVAVVPVAGAAAGDALGGTSGGGGGAGRPPTNTTTTPDPRTNKEVAPPTDKPKTSPKKKKQNDQQKP